MAFAVEPRDFEKSIFLQSDGDAQDRATVDDFQHLADVCSKFGSHVAIVVDAEGEFVCLAPVAVARVIARLLDESQNVGDDIQPANG